MSDRLRQRPEAEARSVENLLERVRTGQIRIPHFQRKLRWRTRNVIELFDSIQRGFPIGELLFSKQAGLEETVHLGPVVIDAKARTDALFIVDGQQRVVSLAGVLLHPEPKPRGDIHAIWYDLEGQTFHRRTSASPPAHWIPLRAVLDSKDLLKWLNVWPLRNEQPDLVDRAIDLGKAIREYQVPAYIVHGAEDRVLRLIFNRTNNSGVPLTEGEVFDALHGIQGRKPIKEACARIAHEGFGDIDPKWFLRSLEAVGGIEPKQKASDLRLEDRPTLVAETEAAVRRTLVFLASDAGISLLDLLPYNLPLVILSKFFHLHPRPSQRSRTLLARWVWRGALTGEHSGSSDAIVRRLTSLVSADESATVQALLRTTSREWDAPDPSAKWTSGAKTRLLALSLLSLNPIDPESGQPFSPEDFAQLEEPAHAFVDIAQPKSRSGCFARFVALPAGPTSQREKLHVLRSSDADVLMSHGLSRKMIDNLDSGNLSEFVRLRSDLLEQLANRVFLAYSGVNDNDRPAVGEILRKVSVA